MGHENNVIIVEKNGMIKSIHLQNFEAHSDLTINFKEGINIIYGKSDCGKSSINRALSWILWNESISGFRKIGTKQTSVKVILNNNIEIERIRSASINRYILRMPDKDELIFDTVAKSVPEEIQKILQIEPVLIDDEKIYLNSAPQISLPFLFDKSGTQRMKLFNQLTGNDILDILFSDFNKDILKINRELKETKEHVEKQKIELEQKEIEKETLEILTKKAKTIFNTIETKYDKCSNLLKIIELDKSISNKLVDTENRLKSIKLPEDVEIKQLREKITRLTVINSVINALEINDNIINKTNTVLSKLIEVDSIKLAFLRDKINRLDKINGVLTNFDKSDILIRELEKKINDIFLDLKRLENEKNKYKFCEVCNGKGVIINV